MKQRLVLIGGLLGLLFASSCQQEEAKSLFFQADERIALSWEGAPFRRITVLEEKGQSAIGIMNWSDTTFQIYRTDRLEKIARKIDLSAFVNAVSLPEVRGLWEFDAAGTLYCFYAELRTLYALNGSGEIVKQWDLSALQDVNGKPYYVQAVPGASYKVVGNQLYIMGVRFDLQFPRNASGLKAFFKDEPTLVQVTLNDSLPQIQQFWGGYNPQTIEKGLNFLNPYPYWCFNRDNELVSAFNGDAETYVYEKRKVKLRKPTSSKFITHINPFPDDSIGNFAAMKEYWAVEGAYRDVIYDPYKDCYYRVAAHPMSYRNADGMLNRMESKPWSLVVLDNQLTKIGEQQFDAELYQNILIAPSKEGLLIGTNRKEDEKSKLIFTRFKLIQS